MHACGHDGHAAVLVALARRLVQRPPRQPVLLLFQQGEEVHPSGAPMVIDGLDSATWPAREVYGMHMWPELPEGTIGLKAGPLMGGVSGVEIELRARTGRTHGTFVDHGATDALKALTRLCTACEQLPSGRRPTAEQPVVVHVGMARVGEAPNQPAAAGTVRATMRWLDHSSREACEKEVIRIASEIGASTDVDITARFDHTIRPLIVNADVAVQRLGQACKATGLQIAEGYPPAPLGVSDDFGCYLEEVPGAMFLVGCGSGGSTPDLHHPLFDFREEVLLPIVDMLEYLANQTSIMDETSR
jgi:amidohydrolase